MSLPYVKPELQASVSDDRLHLESAIMSSTMSSSGCSGTSSQTQKDTFLSVYGCELAMPDADRICCRSAPSTAIHDSGICRATDSVKAQQMDP